MTFQACQEKPDVNPVGPDTPTPLEKDADYPEVGLYIRNGEFHKDGYPYYGYGVNYLNYIMRVIEDDAAFTMSERGLADLADYGIPYARVGGGPFYATGWQKYFADKEAYFKKIDHRVAYAEEVGVGLIPSLFWWPAAIPDVLGEHMDAYGDDNSKTIAFIEQYTAEFVQRYKDSPAIWGYEFGNEFNNVVDIPHVSMPEVLVGKGTPAERDPQHDRFYHEHVQNAYKHFGETVRKYDKERPLFSGDTEPRSSAWHNALHDLSQAWVMDSEEQYIDIISLFEGDPINTLTNRCYCMYRSARDYPMGRLTTPQSYLHWYMQTSKLLGKPLFVGEYGADDIWETDPGNDGNWRKVSSTLDAIQERIDAIYNNKVQLSCFWVYNLPSADGDTNATFSNERRENLLAIVKAQKKYKKYMQNLIDGVEK